MFLKLAVFLLNHEIVKSHDSHGVAVEMSKMLSRKQLDGLSAIAKEAAIRRTERLKNGENKKRLRRR